MVFHHCFCRYFHFTIDFYFFYWVLSSLIAFVPFITVSSSGFFISPLILLLLFRVFSFHQLSLPWLFFFFFRCFVFVLLYRMCHGFERAFFPLSRCLLTLLPDIWHNLLLSMLPWGGQFCLERCRAFNWGSKHRPGPSVCLNHTGFSKRY